MFLVNAASLVWMLLLGVVMALEKNFPWGRRLSAPIAARLLAGALAVVVGGFAPSSKNFSQHCWISRAFRNGGHQATAG